LQILAIHNGGRYGGAAVALPLTSIVTGNDSVKDAHTDYDNYDPHGNEIGVFDSNIPVGNYSYVATVPATWTPMTTKLAPTVFWTGETGVAISRKSKEILIKQEAKFGVPAPMPPAHLLDYACACVDTLYVQQSSVERRDLTLDEVAQLLDKNKASGYGFGPRRSYYDESGEKFTEHFKTRVEWYLDCAATWDQRITPVIIPNLKDEARPIAKVEAGNTRTFEVMPLDYLVAHMVKIGQFHKHLLEIQPRCPSAMGINVDSQAWHDFGLTFLILSLCISMQISNSGMVMSSGGRG